MYKPGDWNKLLGVEPAFLVLEQKILDGSITDFAQIHPEAFSWHGWDLISEERLFAMMVPFLKQQLARAKSSMPQVYGPVLEPIDPALIQSPEDWHCVPVLVKDDLNVDTGGNQAVVHLRGFRQVANQDPTLLRPGDSPAPLVAFGSGGSLGKYTPTFVSLQDRARECQAWRRGHDYHGISPGDIALYTYNTTHKGGQWMQESLLEHGVDVILRRPEEQPDRVLDNLREYKANILFTIQQPPESIQNQSKAGGINLHSLVVASLENPSYQGILVPDSNGRKQIEFIFLGGFEVVPYALELAGKYLGDTPIATLLGSSEAIPQACSTNPFLTPTGFCHYNNLHLLHGPHYIEVVKPQGERWVPVRKGEEGLLVYTSWARDGTIWIRYAPGDVATRLLDVGDCPCGIHTPVVTGVRRKDVQEQAALFLTGCAAG